MSTMAPAVQEPVHNGVRLAEKDRLPDLHSSGFTAVNGRRSQEAERRNGMLEDRGHTRRLQSPSVERVEERRHVSRHPDTWPPANYDRNPDPTPSAQRQDPDVLSPTKRKRSSMKEEDDDRPIMLSPRQSTSTLLGKRIYVESDSSDSDDEHNERPQFHGHKMPDSRTYRSTEADQSWPPSQRNTSNGDSREPESRRRDSPRPDDRLSGVSGDGNSANTVHKTHEYDGTTYHTKAGVQEIPGKRKRVFSNRTKTGCQTCRRRKKKCDEARPECQNCQRGGFVCGGYSNKTMVTKQPSSKGNIPLQSKDGFPEQSGPFKL
ncbi:hypothetical protein K490DRAFT_67182 [Saccharata proteae CBS 121410]|uniref:Zn(2)-C6 fungal-type domain-containing protein n=1 Tax=Saccharata proteae CBS 121410 TaxID=1314787 RepID=A0A9P4HTU9_9PEZI|nr:hypothetical protein K490DRAFT_67182 [Saccharata proteae CBS 121410]